MKKIICFSLTLFSFLLLVLTVFPTNTLAATEIYKVTDPLHLDRPLKIGTNFVHLIKNLTINYKGGNVILSRNPDGTGSINVGDILQIHATNGFTFQLNGYSPACLSHFELQPTDVSSYFTTKKNYSLLIRYIDACGKAKDISSLYIIVKNIPEPTVTPSPTVAPTSMPSPTPAGPQPFLDLPWEYKAKGLSFNDAALSMTSYFDHTLPLLSVSQSIPESSTFMNQVTTFLNEKGSVKNYSSHDGYDYASLASVRLNDPVLAAAAGTARYIGSCKPCGNTVLIDHGNGFQTRYMHLQKDGLVINTEGQTVEVSSRQQIGKVGATGNVIPADDRGAHIHFMVVEDKDDDGSFDDNIPDGVLDPYGWKSTETDPWASYSFAQHGESKVGNRSWYLWTTPLEMITKTLNNQAVDVINGRFKLSFPINSVNLNTVIQLFSGPIVDLGNKLSIGPKLIAEAKDTLGTIVKQLQQPFTITVDYGNLDLSKYNLESASIYSTEDGVTWIKEPTTLNMIEKKATSQLNHFSQFALIAELKDTGLPSTVVTLNDNEDILNTYTKDVKVTLETEDEQDAVSYTMIKVDENDWEQYISPQMITSEGNHIIQFYSVDESDNAEEVQTVEFSIVKSAPEAKILFNDSTGKLEVTSAAQSPDIEVKSSRINTFIKRFTITNKTDSKLTIDVFSLHIGKIINVENIQNIRYNNEPAKQFQGSLTVTYDKDKKNKVTTFEQIFRSGDRDRIKLEYNPVKNKTSITTWEKTTPKIKEIVSGIKILTLITNKGEILFSY